MVWCNGFRICQCETRASRDICPPWCSWPTWSSAKLVQRCSSDQAGLRQPHHVTYVRKFSADHRVMAENRVVTNHFCESFVGDFVFQADSKSSAPYLSTYCIQPLSFNSTDCPGLAPIHTTTFTKQFLQSDLSLFHCSAFSIWCCIWKLIAVVWPCGFWLPLSSPLCCRPCYQETWMFSLVQRGMYRCLSCAPQHQVRSTSIWFLQR